MNKSKLIQLTKQKIDLNKRQAEEIAHHNFLHAQNDFSFKANTHNIAAVEMQIAKLECENQNTQTENELLKVLQNERNQILKKLNIKQNDLVPNYFCKLCSDSGILNNQYCSCFKQIYNNELNKITGITFDKTHTFKNADLKLFDKNDNMKKAYLKLEEFCNKYPDVKIKTITLVGQVGVGKTYLTECICNLLLNKDFVVRFVTSFNFNNTMLKYHTCFDDQKQTYLESMLDPDVLVIDDLGTEPMLNNVTKEYLFLVLNERILSNKTTIITTNLSLDEIINKYGERIFSRLTDKSNGLPLNLTGDDLRHKNKN